MCVFKAQPTMAQIDQNWLQYSRQQHDRESAADDYDRERPLGLSADAR